MDFKASVKDKIESYCAQTKLTHEELAEKVEVSSNTISKWVNGTSVISGDKLVRLAEAMNMSIDYLAGVKEIAPGDIPKEIAALSDIFQFDLAAHTVTITNHLAQYLTDLKEVDEAVAKGLPEEGRKYWIQGLQEKYRKRVLEEDTQYFTFEIHEKGFLEDHDRKLRLEYGKIPAPGAGYIEPPKE